MIDAGEPESRVINLAVSDVSDGHQKIKETAETLSSLRRQNNQPTNTDTILRRLKAAGAVPVGEENDRGIAPAEQERIVTAKDLRKAPAVLTETIDRRLITAPWAFLKTKAEEAGIENLGDIFDRLAQDEEALLVYKQIERLLLSDDAEKIKRGLQLVQTLPPEDKQLWLVWISQTQDPDVKKIVAEFEKSIGIDSADKPETSQAQLTRPTPKTTPEYMIARSAKITKDELTAILTRSTQVKNMASGAASMKLRLRLLLSVFSKTVFKK